MWSSNMISKCSCQFFHNRFKLITILSIQLKIVSTESSEWFEKWFPIFLEMVPLWLFDNKASLDPIVRRLNKKVENVPSKVHFLNPLLHRLFLGHDIIFYFRQHQKKNLSKVLNTFENIMENRAWSKCSIFHNIFKYIVFQRHQKALSWSKGLNQSHLVEKWLPIVLS